MTLLNLYILLLLTLPFLTPAQDTAAETTPQTLFFAPAYSAQLPCAQDCFLYDFAGCEVDAVGSVIGCHYGYCSDNSAQLGAPDNCYCRTDLQPAAERWLSTCVQSRCTEGDAAIDVGTAVGLYTSYCASKGFPVAAAAPTASAPAVTAASGTGARTASTGAGSNNAGSGNNVGSGDTNCGGINNSGTVDCNRNGGMSTTDQAILGSVLGFVAVIIAIISLCA